MSRLSRFKYQRAIPIAATPGTLHYSRFDTRPLRQLPSFTGTATSGGARSPMFGCFVPASSWGLNKLLMIRALVLTEAGPAVSEPAYNMQEFFSITGAAPVSSPPYAASTLVSGIYNTERVIKLIRADPYIYAWDEAQTYQHNSLNDADRNEFILTVPAISPPFLYSSQIMISYDALLPAASGIVTAGAIWCEAFLEQATNLGALP